MALAPRIPHPTFAKMGRVRDNDRNHLDMLALLPDAIFGTYDDVHGHHPRHAVDHLPTGTGRRADDRHAVPLGHRSHFEGVHKDGDEQAYFEHHGFDWRDLSKALWACRGQDLAAYEYVMFKHLQARGIHIEFRPSPVMKKTRRV